MPAHTQVADELLHLYWKDRQTGTVEEVDPAVPMTTDT